MPSPFPGMDPYLEGSLWTTFHAQLAAEIARQLAPKLRPKYVALTTERFVIDILEDFEVTRASVYPDVAVAESKTGRVIRESALTADVVPLRLATIIPTPVPHFSVEVRDVANRELVTAIEILAPANNHGEGRREYVAKRQRLLMSAAHLMEIDLLRSGQRVPMQQPLPNAPYFVLLSRFSTRPIVEVWPIALDQSLPTAPVPLLNGNPDVLLDLQLAFNSIYDLLGYDLLIDYARPPDTPLEGEEATWVSERLRSLRSMLR